jgi:hypothetical protein
MDIAVLTRGIEKGRGVAITDDDLAPLLENTALLLDHDTSIAGHIRVLGFGETILVQEQTPEGALFLRELPSEEAARRFVDDRLAAYERMWDG